MHEEPDNRFYWCPTCDVYGRGSECWGCDSTDVEWNYVPREKIPTSGGANALVRVVRS